MTAERPNAPNPMTRVLLVDDDAELAELVGEYLAREGFSLDAETDGTRAVDRAASGDYQLTVLDVMLPGVSGFDVLRPRRARRADGGGVRAARAADARGRLGRPPRRPRARGPGTQPAAVRSQHRRAREPGPEEARPAPGRRRADHDAAGRRLPVHAAGRAGPTLMVPGVFLKILLWFWTSLVLVALALELAITATSTPVEVRVSRFSESVLTSRAHEAVAILDRGGPRKLARFLDELERTTRVHAVLLDPDGYDVSGRTVPPKAGAVAARALASGQTEMEADGHTAVKARAVTVSGGRRYVLVAAVPIGLMRLLHDGPYAQALRVLAVLVTAAAACYGLARYVVRPLATLRAATRALAKGDLSVRVGSTIGRGRDEFVELGHDFDRMAERLDALVTAERRLLRDISHELRSPLARLNVALGLARQPGGEDQAVLDRIEREAERLNALVGPLLMLAWLERR